MEMAALSGALVTSTTPPKRQRGGGHAMDCEPGDWAALVLLETAQDGVADYVDVVVMVAKKPSAGHPSGRCPSIS